VNDEQRPRQQPPQGMRETEQRIVPALSTRRALAPRVVVRPRPIGLDRFFPWKSRARISSKPESIGTGTGTTTRSDRSSPGAFEARAEREVGSRRWPVVFTRLTSLLGAARSQPDGPGPTVAHHAATFAEDSALRAKTTAGALDGSGLGEGSPIPKGGAYALPLPRHGPSVRCFPPGLETAHSCDVRPLAS